MPELLAVTAPQMQAREAQAAAPHPVLPSPSRARLMVITVRKDRGASQGPLETHACTQCGWGSCL